jgi:hypothetical protein
MFIVSFIAPCPTSQLTVFRTQHSMCVILYAEELYANFSDAGRDDNAGQLLRYSHLLASILTGMSQYLTYVRDFKKYVQCYRVAAVLMGFVMIAIEHQRKSWLEHSTTLLHYSELTHRRSTPSSFLTHVTVYSTSSTHTSVSSRILVRVTMLSAGLDSYALLGDIPSIFRINFCEL